MSLHRLQSSPSPRLIKLVEQQQWDELTRAVEDGAPANAPTRGRLTLFEWFLAKAAAAPSETEVCQAQMRAMAALTRAWPGNDPSRLTPITLAALAGRVDMVAHLLNAGHDPNEQGEGGHNAASAVAMANVGGPLSLKRQRNQPEIGWDDPLVSNRLAVLGVLCARGLDVDRPAWHGATPLTLACLAKHTSCARFLLASGAHPEPGPPPTPGAPPIYALAPLEAAILTHNEGLAAALVNAGANILRAPSLSPTGMDTLVEVAGGLGMSGMLQAMRSRLPMDHPAFAAAWRSALVLGNEDTVDWCLRHGFNMDAPVEVSGAARPAHLACFHGYEGILMRLLALGVDMEAPTVEGHSAWDVLSQRHPLLSLRLRPQAERGTVVPFRRPRR